MERTIEIGLELIFIDKLNWFSIAADRIARLSQRVDNGLHWVNPRPVSLFFGLVLGVDRKT